ncbi:OmpA family protein [Desulfohalobium retbaense]|uniref:OmpA/MotB domain protein n=1 Tax=Desulfohalobium retbaense (strain ATCC 49708 / DSM 5692 / JCM 16813 / HR100) TaxID=485915 RepID=C8X1M2_DESRD|nr:OmpA family protein [Desulfohalobium retbaense]ACV68444.1 OmpA/MotB domain protein [Desulfohalobium retbaense DSM 5692]
MSAKPLIRTILLFAVSVLAFGCSQTPAPMSRPYTTQDKLQAAQHWEIIAQDVSTDISHMIKMSDLENFQNKQIQILQTDNSPFSKALESFLVTDLTHLGLQTTRDATDDYQVYWSVQRVTHKKIAFLSQAEVVQNEVIVNLTIQSGDSIVYRLSNTYYVDDLNTENYHFSNDLYYADKEVETRTVYVTNTDTPLPMADKDDVGMIFFQFDKASIQDQYTDELDEYVALLRRNPQMELLIEGHTDIIGSEKYNLDLSLQRAMAVHDYFVRHNISSERLRTKGYGFNKPIAPNFTQNRKDNPEGRANNRRVELHPQPAHMASTS